MLFAFSTAMLNKFQIWRIALDINLNRINNYQRIVITI